MHGISIVWLVSGLDEWDKVVVDVTIIGVASSVNPVVTRRPEHLACLRHCRANMAKMLFVAIDEGIPMFSQDHKEVVPDV